jgi:hypothetical protein
MQGGGKGSHKGVTRLMSRKLSSQVSSIVHGLAIYDGASEELVEFIPINHFDLARFSKQFDVLHASDPQMHDRYSVGPDDAQFVRQELGEMVNFDFKNKAYFIEAVEDK